MAVDVDSLKKEFELHYEKLKNEYLDEIRKKEADNSRLNDQISMVQQQNTELINQNQLLGGQIADLNENIKKLCGQLESSDRAAKRACISEVNSNTHQSKKRNTDSIKKNGLDDKTEHINETIISDDNKNIDPNNIGDNNEKHMETGNENGGNNNVNLVQNKVKKDKNIQPLLVEAGINGVVALKNIINRHLGIKEYAIQQFNSKKPVKIIPIDINARDKLIKILTENKYGFSSYNNKDEKMKCFVMRGILIEMSCDEIKTALINSGCFPNEIEVARLTTGFQRKNPNNNHNILYRIIVPSSFDANNFKNISGIDGMRVKFEPFKSNKTLQCKNCQRYWHSAGQCFFDSRCVKCNTPHPKNQCPRDENPLLPVACCNCGGAHSANNVNECEYYKKSILPVINKKSGNDNHKIVTNNNKKSNTSTTNSSGTSGGTNGVSWADMVSRADQSGSICQNGNRGNTPIDNLISRFDKFMNFMEKFIGNISK